MKRAVSLVLPSLLALLGCEPRKEEAARAPEEVACDEYCSAAQEVGCPQSGECVDDCLSQVELGCVAQLVDLLECMRPALAEDCVPRAAGGKVACAAELFEYNDCLPAIVSGRTCGPSTAMSPGGGDVSCQGDWTCEDLAFGVSCDAEGACTCRVNGQAIGTCTKPVLSAYFCSPHASCCTSMFFE